MPRRTLRELALRAFARVGTGYFFRSVEVDGAERVPRGAPLVIVANHANGIVDPALLVAYLPVTGRPLATSRLWGNPLMRLFLALGGAIPVKRRIDGAAPGDNDDMFTSCHAALRRGQALLVFPEGVSHDSPSVLPLKTGVARIVLEAEARFGPLGSLILPVGIVYDAKQFFRSRALLTVGEPLEPAPELAGYAADPREAVRRLTARVEEALARVAPHHESWEEERLLRRAAVIHARPEAEVPTAVALAERHRLTKAFASGYRALKAAAPEPVAEVEARMREYDALLARHGLKDGQVAARYPAWLVAAHTLHFLELALVRLPAAVLGSIVNWLPYRGSGWIAAAMDPTPDGTASWKLYAAMLLFPAWWLLLTAASWLAGGGVAAVFAAVLGPWTAFEAMRYNEMRLQFLEQVRAFLILRARREIAADLRARRADLNARIGALVAAFREREGGA